MKTGFEVDYSYGRNVLIISLTSRKYRFEAPTNARFLGRHPSLPLLYKPIPPFDPINRPFLWKSKSDLHAKLP